MDTRNLKTWTLRGGRKVLVAFTAVEAEKFNDMMRFFNFMADGHVRVDDKMNNLSLDEMQENPTAKYKEPAGISSAEEDYFAFIEMTGSSTRSQKKMPKAVPFLPFWQAEWKWLLPSITS